MLSISNLSVTLSGQRLIGGVSFDVQAGESGAGKSTLLKALMGSYPAQYDRFDYAPAPDLRHHRLGLPGSRWVMQDSLAAPNPKRSLGQSICESLHRRGLSAAAERTAAMAALAEVELSEEYYDRLPRQVSLGQAQRACLARALVTEPDLIIFDEPLSALDALVQKKIALRMDQLRREKALTYIVVTHDLGFAATYADRILLLRAGKVEAFQTRDAFFAAPASAYARDLASAARSLGALKYLEAAQ